MDETTFSFAAADGSDIAVYRWSGDEAPKAIVQIAHGMGEHAARYRRLAEALTAAGYVVYANDHRGHGTTAGSADHHGDLGAGGWVTSTPRGAAESLGSRRAPPRPARRGHPPELHSID
jgi:alpha-beta hydrolase superfamily lysophospholipase